MTSKNDITGDPLVSKTATDAYRDNWDRIFGKKPAASEEKFQDPSHGAATKFLTGEKPLSLKDDEETE